jgi:four helix bundle protein
LESYRSLHAWQHSHELTLLVWRVCRSKRGSETWALFDQLRRAALSVETNIVEGYALQTPALFRRHVRIALGSAAEAECIIKLAEEVGCLKRQDCREALRILNRLVPTLRGLMRQKSVECPAT